MPLLDFLLSADGVFPFSVWSSGAPFGNLRSGPPTKDSRGLDGSRPSRTETVKEGVILLKEVPTGPVDGEWEDHLPRLEDPRRHFSVPRTKKKY